MNVADKDKYDIAICGLGCSGLSLATELASLKNYNGRILLLEPNKNITQEKTWCYWNVHQHVMSSEVIYRWKQWKIKLGNNEIVHSSQKYCYEQIESRRYTDHCYNKLRHDDRFTFEIGSSVDTIDKIDDMNAVVSVSEKKYIANKVFDSRPKDLQANQLLQHFKGWHVKSRNAIFDPTTVTLMDFKPCEHGVNFYYILPYSENEALIENTYFSQGLLSNETYEKELENYLTSDLKSIGWTILREEQGVIPMHINVSQVTLDDPIINIGVTAGFAKSSTGYCYLNIQKFAQYVRDNVNKLSERGSYKLRPKFSAFLDSIFTEYIVNHSQQAPETLFTMFKHNSADRIVRFLSDMPSFLDYVGIIKSMPKSPMLIETYKTTLNRA